MDEIYDVAVVGAGLAGLTAAAVAAGAGARVLVLEAHQPGGRAATAERDGYHLNQGPHALYLGGPGESVLRQLGVDYRGHPPAGPYYARRGDDVQLWPVSGATLARSGLVSVRGKVRLGTVLHRPVLEAWATWDARFGVLPRRPDVARAFDFAFAR